MAQKEHSINTKVDILDAAEILFAEKGFDGTGIMEIATRAGVPKSLIYYYFSSKEKILNELINRLLEAIVAVKKETAAQVKPEDMLTRDGLYRSLNTLYTFIERHKNVYRIMHQEALKKDFIGNLLLEIPVSQQASIDYFKEAGMTVNENDIKLGHFFLIATPFISFMLLKEKWCEQNSMDPGEVKEKFFELIADISTLIVSRSVSAEHED
jgi:AcrR family transcriptional regulator